MRTVTRALRRHHERRIKARRGRLYWGATTGRELTPRHAGMAARTPKPCACMQCANPRWYAGPTLQERREMQRGCRELAERRDGYDGL